MEPNLFSPMATKSYWESVNQGFLGVIAVMESREKWALDSGESIDMVSTTYNAICQKWKSHENDQEFTDSIIQFLAGLRFGLSLMILGMLDEQLQVPKDVLAQLSRKAANNITNKESEKALNSASVIFYERLKILYASNLWAKVFKITKEAALNKYLEQLDQNKS